MSQKTEAAYNENVHKGSTTKNYTLTVVKAFKYEHCLTIIFTAFPGKLY